MNIISTILKENLALENDILKIYPGILDGRKLLDLFEIYSNPSNVSGYANPIYDVKSFVNIMVDKISRHQNKINGYVCYFIELKENSKVIGLRNIILDGIYNNRNEIIDNKKNVIAEIILNINYWNSGLAIQSSEIIFAYLKSMGVKNICTFIQKNNSKAISLNKRLKFMEIDDMTLEIIYGYDKDFEILCNNLNESRIFIKGF